MLKYMCSSHSQRHVAAISVWCCSYIKGQNWGRGLSFTVEIQVYNFVVIPNNGIIKCILLMLLKLTCCSVLVTCRVVGLLCVTMFQA